MELQGKTAIVTGAGRGIGRAIAVEFARQGANVVCAARSQAEVIETAALAQKEGVQARAIPTDVTDRDQVENLVSQTLAEFGQIDVLFNNAGRFHAIGAVWEVDPADWWKDVTVNVFGPILCCRAVLPLMLARNEGVILNMSGGGAGAPFAGGSGYGSSKAALLRFTDTLAKELEAVNSSVLVFSMGPGLVHTKMTQYQADNPQAQRWLPRVVEMLETGKHRPPEDCAKATVELLRIACPELNGRSFGVSTNFDEIGGHLREIHENDLHVLRMRVE